MCTFRHVEKFLMYISSDRTILFGYIKEYKLGTGLRDMFLSDTEGSEHLSLPTPTRRYAQNKTGKTKIKQTRTDKKNPVHKKKEVKKSTKKEVPQEKEHSGSAAGTGERKIISRIPITR